MKCGINRCQASKLKKGDEITVIGNKATFVAYLTKDIGYEGNAPIVTLNSKGLLRYYNLSEVKLTGRKPVLYFRYRFRFKSGSTGWYIRNYYIDESGNNTTGERGLSSVNYDKIKIGEPITSDGQDYDANKDYSNSDCAME